MTDPLVRATPLLLVLTLACAFSLPGCATTGASVRKGSVDPAVGHALPPIELPDLRSGQPVSIADTGGRVVLLDFWATWCKPCVKSLPVYEAWQRELGPRGFAVVAVSVDEQGAQVAEFVGRLAPSVQVLLDPQGLAPAALSLAGLPVSYLVGRDGVVRSQHLGFHTEDGAAVKAEIEELLAEPAPGEGGPRAPGQTGLE